MRNKIFILFFTLLFPLMIQAQVKFGYLSYDQALRSLPEYTMTQENMADLRSKFDAEMKCVEEDFNRKYEEFLDGQRDFAPTILQKRQTELQEMLTRNVAFKAESEKLLQQAEVEAMAPLREKLRQAIQRVGAEGGYAFILNTDGDACPYIDPEMGEDVTLKVAAALK
ncbi:MAG: OmpH family outer membrane protein [Prevotella sp.]|nr:OmpH family outer membrane protein [Prevotella sp.]